MVHSVYLITHIITDLLMIMMLTDDYTSLTHLVHAD